MKNAKIIGITVAAFLIGAAVIAANKAVKLKETFDKMTIKPVWISKIKITLTQLSFNLDIKITNPTGDDFALSGFSAAALKRVNIFYKGTYFGSAVANITEISIPNNNELIIRNLPVVVATQNILSNIMTIENISVNDLTIQAVVTVLGKDYIIEN
jgi:hypothetical protein